MPYNYRAPKTREYVKVLFVPVTSSDKQSLYVRVTGYFSKGGAFQCNTLVA